MPAKSPTLMDAHEAAKVLEASLKNPHGPFTVADAAAQSGLALRDTERGLNWLMSTYRGHLRVTEEGELLFLFPHGFTKPWEKTDALKAGLRAVGKLVGGVARFVVRAWLTIVIFAYAALFFAILLGLTFARQGGSSSRDDGFPGAHLGYLVFRVLADALFWTFHPFSPIYIAREDTWTYGHAYRDRRSMRAHRPADGTPFYEKVNRFVFGPPPPQEDPRALERRILAEIRAQKGRIGLADVMRVTGLPRDQADPLMARLMLDYDGDVEVSEEGGITYRFEAIRKTASDGPSPRPAPVWASPKRLPPLTGNSAGTNVLIGALNGFNLLMGLYALGANLTLDRLAYMWRSAGAYGEPIPMPYDGVPIVLGLVPVLFSLAIFLFPLGRALLRPVKAKAVARENGRLAVLREILSGVKQGRRPTEEALKRAWAQAAGRAPGDKELTRAVVDLGGDVDMQNEGEVRYRFIDLETEAAALEEERAAADEREAQVGRVIFGSDR